MNGASQEQYDRDWTNYIQYANSLSAEEMAIRDKGLQFYFQKALFREDRKSVV